MIKSTEIFKAVGILIVVIGLLVLSSSAISTSPIYRFAAISLITLVGAGLSLRMGVQLLREAQNKGTPLLWWKQYYIIVALSILCWGGVLLLGTFIPAQRGNLLVSGINVLFILLASGLTLYWIILSWPFSWRKRR